MIARLQNPVLAAAAGLLLSIGTGVGLSWPVLERAVTAAVAARHKPPSVASELKQKGWDFWTIEIENLSHDLKEERLRLKQRMESVDQRAARLAAEEAEFAKARTEIETLRREIADKVVEIRADEARNIRTLAATYSSLTPRGAVAIFREMDDTTVVKILGAMKPDAVGPIFEEMSKATGADPSMVRRAALLSERLRLMKAARSSSS